MDEVLFFQIHSIDVALMLIPHNSSSNVNMTSVNAAPQSLMWSDVNVLPLLDTHENVR